MLGYVCRCIHAYMYTYTCVWNEYMYWSEVCLWLLGLRIAIFEQPEHEPSLTTTYIHICNRRCHSWFRNAMRMEGAREAATEREFGNPRCSTVCICNISKRALIGRAIVRTSYWTTFSLPMMSVFRDGDQWESVPTPDRSYQCMLLLLISLSESLLVKYTVPSI